MDAGRLKTSHRPMGSDKSLRLSLLDLPLLFKLYAQMIVTDPCARIRAGVGCKNILGHFMYTNSLCIPTVYNIWIKKKQ